MDISAFAKRLKELMQNAMPIDGETIHTIKKHGQHIRDIALAQNPIIPVGLDSMYFEIGSEIAEEKKPSYHILEDAQVIRKKGFATKSTKGSQASVYPLGKRDYGIAQFKLTTNRKKAQPYYEYRKNVRGERSLVGKSTQKVYTTNGQSWTINRQAKYYKNIHYHYIERNMELINQTLASEFGLKLKRTQIDFTEEYSDFIDNLY